MAKQRAAAAFRTELCAAACEGISTEALAAGVVARMAALVRAGEWNGVCEDREEDCCSECGALTGSFHKPGCEYAAVLALLGGAPAGGQG